MAHNALGAIVQLRRTAAIDAQALDQIKQRPVHLRHGAGFRRPVVHFGVDVHRPLAVPGRLDFVVPNALKVRRLRSGSAAGDQQIAPILKIERFEFGIGAGGRQRYPLVCRARRRVAARSEPQRDPAEQLPMIRYMLLAQCLEGFLGDGGGMAPAARGGIGRDIVVMRVIGRRHEDQRRRARAVDLDRFLRNRGASAFGADNQPRFEPHRSALDCAGDRQSFGIKAAQSCAFMGAGQRGAKGGRIGPIGFDPPDNGLGGSAGERLAFEASPAETIGDAGNGRIQVQIPAILRSALARRKLDPQIAERLIGLLPQRVAHHGFQRQRFGFLLPPAKSRRRTSPRCAAAPACV